LNHASAGHRFFFRAEEVEVLSSAETAAALPRILVAGIGNIFFGDDGFGVEVAVRLEACKLPFNAQVIDFGIRSYDLAYALTSGRYDAAILVDATSALVNPELFTSSNPARAWLGTRPANAHAMNPETVLRMASTLGTLPGQISDRGLRTGNAGREEGQLGLSQTVDAAVDRAACSGGIAGDPDLQRRTDQRDRSAKGETECKRWNITKIKRMTLGTL